MSKEIEHAPKIYIGICEKSKQGNGNLNHVFVECPDGMFRSFNSKLALTINQVESDVKNNFLKRIIAI